MKNKTTFCVLNYGIFICESCALLHWKNNPMQKHYLKDVWNEHWDPHQLIILAVSNNQPWYEQLKHYKLEKGTYN